jgi:outer membrane lipoprotein
LIVLLLAGCAGNGCRTAVGDRRITPAIAATAEIYVGRLVQWGGLLVETRNLKDRTELQVVGYPLDDCGRPRMNAPSIGRFIVSRPGYLETVDFRAGRLLTASGQVGAIRDDRGGGTHTRLPVLESFNPYLWPVRDDGEQYRRPWVSIGIGGGSGGVGGGIGVTF